MMITQTLSLTHDDNDDDNANDGDDTDNEDDEGDNDNTYDGDDDEGDDSANDGNLRSGLCAGAKIKKKREREIKEGLTQIATNCLPPTNL